RCVGGLPCCQGPEGPPAALLGGREGPAALMAGGALRRSVVRVLRALQREGPAVLRQRALRALAGPGGSCGAAPEGPAKQAEGPRGVRPDPCRRRFVGRLCGAAPGGGALRQPRALRRRPEGLLGVMPEGPAALRRSSGKRCVRGPCGARAGGPAALRPEALRRCSGGLWAALQREGLCGALQRRPLWQEAGGALRACVGEALPTLLQAPLRRRSPCGALRREGPCGAASEGPAALRRETLRLCREGAPALRREAWLPSGLAALLQRYVGEPCGAASEGPAALRRRALRRCVGGLCGACK
ncbi:hypothetical protein CYMTET_31502, partial [Cymbomonas tetramitiformis]